MFNLAKDYFYDYNVITSCVQPVWANCYQDNFSSLSDNLVLIFTNAHAHPHASHPIKTNKKKQKKKKKITKL